VRPTAHSLSGGLGAIAGCDAQVDESDHTDPQRNLKVRMEEPEEFLKRMNQLCMKMTHARRKKNARQARKAVLREMKKLSKIIAGHAERHRDLLETQWQETDLKAGEARQIIQRITTVLERLPQAIRQAHERIIGERPVKNAEKILSLYEAHAAVYVRGKAGAEVEFGSQWLLGEAESGVIVDWELVRGNPLADTKMLSRSMERMKQLSAGRSSSRSRATADSTVHPIEPYWSKTESTTAFARSRRRNSRRG
jgi:hypothetical protein